MNVSGTGITAGKFLIGSASTGVPTRTSDGRRATVPAAGDMG